MDNTDSNAIGCDVADRSLTFNRVNASSKYAAAHAPIWVRLAITLGIFRTTENTKRCVDKDTPRLFQACTTWEGTLGVSFPSMSLYDDYGGEDAASKVLARSTIVC